jgi:hypothetical protein
VGKTKVHLEDQDVDGKKYKIRCPRKRIGAEVNLTYVTQNGDKKCRTVVSVGNFLAWLRQDQIFKTDSATCSKLNASLKSPSLKYTGTQLPTPEEAIQHV